MQIKNRYIKTHENRDTAKEWEIGRITKVDA